MQFDKINNPEVLPNEELKSTFPSGPEVLKDGKFHRILKIEETQVVSIHYSSSSLNLKFQNHKMLPKDLMSLEIHCQKLQHPNYRNKVPFNNIARLQDKAAH